MTSILILKIDIYKLILLSAHAETYMNCLD